MSNDRSTRQGPLKPRSSKDSVIVEDPSRDSLRMTADEADLSAFRMIDAAAEARENEQKGERDD